MTLWQELKGTNILSRRIIFPFLLVPSIQPPRLGSLYDPFHLWSPLIFPEFSRTKRLKGSTSAMWLNILPGTPTFAPGWPWAGLVSPGPQRGSCDILILYWSYPLACWMLGFTCLNCLGFWTVLEGFPALGQYELNWDQVSPKDGMVTEPTSLASAKMHRVPPNARRPSPIPGAPGVVADTMSNCAGENLILNGHDRVGMR